VLGLYLLADAECRLCEVSAAAVAENTAARAFAPVDIRTGKTAVYHGFIKLMTVYAAEVIIQRMIAFIVDRVQKWTFAHALTSMNIVTHRKKLVNILFYTVKIYCILSLNT
jgi:hypothetical protein